ncbi:BTAD domain-containing putative transcriptional regulator [Dactylosporangium sp. NPDC006015]|uniref:BTAD domain-containing putative transcriptional regulator n=1 Tax=Dactylosporangium sp. NPDC006015 TaxID=3154576 RepID=UPI0033BDC65B
MSEPLIRVLGPVEVQAPGRSPVSPAPSVRALLARLAGSPGRVMSADALTDALWGEELPADAANALQIRVSKLRRVLASAGLDAAVLTTRAPGYQLTLPPEAVDAHRFDKAVARARTAADQDTALAAYDEALGLWRGPALADVGETDWVRAERLRLEELRLAALEDRLELLVGTGRHAAVVGELESMVAEHPLRERLHRLLMLALYRAGRQADALAVEQRLRHRLAEELGIDPSPDLRALTEAILRQEIPPATPAAPAMPATTPAAPAPSVAVPARLSSFLGRDADLRTTLQELRAARLVTLTGPGGVGKTTLSLETARLVEPAIADTVHIIRLAALAPDADVAEAFAAQLGVQTPGPGASAAEAVAEHLKQRRALLVVDNCEHVVDAAAVVVDHLLQATTDVRVLATSREALAVAGETQIAVGPLAVPDETAAADAIAASPAVRLFLDRARSVRPGLQLDADAARAVASICRRLDGMPLAIELAAARAKALPPAEIADRLRDRFALLTAGPRSSEARHRTLRATIDWSHDLLPEGERRLLRRLAVFRGGWTLAAAEQVCGFGGSEPADIPDLLFRLVDQSLVTADPGTGRFRLLVTIREYAWMKLREAGEEDDCRRRHLAHCIAMAEQHGPLVRYTGPAWDLLVEDQDNLRAAIEFCIERTAESPEPGLRLAAALVPFWNYGPRYEGVRAITALLDRGGSDVARARALQGLALLYVYYPTPESRAAARESLALFAALGLDHEAAVSRIVVAFEGQYGGDPDEHRELIRRSREDLGDQDHGWWHAMTYYVEALINLRCSEFEDSVRDWRRSLDLLGAADDRMMSSAARAHLGVALRQTGRLEEALAQLRSAADECRAYGSLHGLAFALVHLAHTRLDLGQTERVPAELAEADEISRRVRNPRNPAWAAWGRARLALTRGDAAAAADDLRRALELLEDREFPWARDQLRAAYAAAAGH